MKAKKNNNRANWLKKKNWIWTAFFLLTVLVGIGIRLFDLQDPPLDFHPTRQLHSAVIARGIYYQGLDNTPEWKRQLSLKQWKSEGLIEPQIMEQLVAFSYKVIGEEDLYVARIWPILFWGIGAVFLFLTVVKFSSPAGAAVSVLVYMIWPYTAIASRAFQPEPLLVMMIIIASWAFFNFLQSRNVVWAVATGILCGLALYVKVVAVFFLAPAFAVPLIMRDGFKKTLLSKFTWLIAVLAILPYLAYHLYGTYALGLLGSQFAFRFFPQRWLDPVFYLQWLSELDNVFQIWLVVFSFLAGILGSKSKHRGFIIGYWIGYLLYGFTFSYHITTHDYYHLPLIIPISIGLGTAAELLIEKTNLSKRKSKIILVVTLFFLLSWNVWEIRSTLKRVDYQEEVDYWAYLGEQLGHKSRVIGLFHDYGYRLAYWGWMDVTPWRTTDDIHLREISGRDVTAIEDEQKKLNFFDYFIIADQDELRQQPELLSYLQGNHFLVEETDHAMVFKLNNP